MDKKDRENINGIYENYVTRGQSGQRITDRNARRMQSSELTSTAHKCEYENLEKETTWRIQNEGRQTTDDIYENYVIGGISGEEIIDCSTMRIQPSELTGTGHKCDYENIKKETTWRIQKGGRQTIDDIYENDVIRCISGEEINKMRIQSSELTGRMRSFRSATVCLVLLCVLLLTAVIAQTFFIYNPTRKQNETGHEYRNNAADLIIRKTNKILVIPYLLLLIPGLV
ncbi:uncharacterized protein isoform X2 [Danio rerio]|uniref:Uncharacterized protein isoform X2 n=1 Tax=Danio rerio TaxID=7955 RepID=A0AC58GM78_DANRE